MRVGTVIAATPNPKARVPALVLEIDFGPELGRRLSSARITDLYRAEELVGRQVVAVMNFAPIRIAGVKSEVLVLGATPAGGVVLLAPERPVPDGSRIA
ncbi:MAG: tRNA-binding protein [Planctomycetes bacterium]|nr:tRNA-binding protein [Planctomycetota bacterium]